MAHRKAQEVFYEIANPKVVEVCEMMRSILAEREARHINLLNHIQDEAFLFTVPDGNYVAQNRASTL